MRVRLWLLGTELFDLVLGELPTTENTEGGVRAVDGTHHEASYTSTHLGFYTPGGYVPDEDQR